MYKLRRLYMSKIPTINYYCILNDNIESLSASINFIVEDFSMPKLCTGILIGAWQA